MGECSTESDGEFYEKGTVLLTEKPFAFVLKGTLHSERCDHCFAKADLLKCSCCSYAHYCSRECQKKSWAYWHKIECESIQKIAPNKAPDSARYLARIIIRLQKNEVHNGLIYSRAKSRKFDDLMSHKKEILEDPKRLKPFLDICAVLERYLDKELLPEPGKLFEILGKMVINTFCILDENFTNIGTGLYLAASIFDHSCAPNAAGVFHGTTITVRTIKTLKNIDFSNIYITYREILDLPSKRQKELEELYYFQCQCERCTDPQELKEMTCIICPNESCQSAILGGLSDPSPICPKCNLEVPNETLEEIKEVVSFTEDNLNKMEDKAYLDVCEVCLRKLEPFLHPMNIYNVKVLHTAFESCIALEKWEDAFMYGLKAKDYLRKYYGPISPSFGTFLVKLGRLAGLVERLDEERKSMLEGFEILLVAMGNKHPYMVNEVIPNLPPQ